MNLKVNPFEHRNFGDFLVAWGMFTITWNLWLSCLGV